MLMVDINVIAKENGLKNVKNHIVKLAIFMIKLQINAKEINALHKTQNQYLNYTKKSLQII
jgi:hypothetical protein